jgi:hypothetical protein
MRGMVMSRIMTSGFSSWAKWIACSPSVASPQISQSGRDFAKSDFSPSRKTSWSSTIRICAVITNFSSSYLLRIGKPKQSWRINMMPTGDGSFYLYLHETIRNASGSRVGDRVTVELSFGRDYRSGPVHPLPRWLRTALAANPKAKSSWNTLTPSRKKEILRYFASLKSPVAKVRNLRRVIEALSGKEVRFMARTLERRQIALDPNHADPLRKP